MGRQEQTLNLTCYCYLDCHYILYLSPTIGTIHSTGFDQISQEFYTNWITDPLIPTTLRSFNISSCVSTEEEFCRIRKRSANKKFPTWRLAYCEIHWKRFMWPHSEMPSMSNLTTHLHSGWNTRARGWCCYGALMSKAFLIQPSHLRRGEEQYDNNRARRGGCNPTNQPRSRAALLCMMPISHWSLFF